MLAKALNNGAVYAIVTAIVFYLTAEMIIQVHSPAKGSFPRKQVCFLF
jgi:hypothetical protein